MDHSIRRLVWVSGLLAAASFVYVLVFLPVQDPRARARAAGDEGGARAQSVSEMDSAYRTAVSEFRLRSAERISEEMAGRFAEQPVSWFNRGLALRRLGQEQEAHRAWARLLGLIGSMPAENDRSASRVAYYRGWALLGLGETGPSVGQFTEAMDLYLRSLGGAEPVQGEAYNLACYAALAGQTERAMGYWERALSTGYPDGASWWAMDPDLDPIRGDPRFSELARRYGYLE